MFSLPSEVEAVVKEFRTCEFTTIAKDGTPISWPLTSSFEPETGRFLLITSIGLPQKVFNIRRNPKVSLLFSNPTGSGLVNPPSVLVQGTAQASDVVEVSPARNEELRKGWHQIMRFQPASPVFGDDALTHYFFDWYYMRLVISVIPHRICWWKQGDFTQEPQELEVNHVG